MCRHLAYLGRPLALGALLTEPSHSLVRQSYAPRRQRYGTVNADGFGVGWYLEGDPLPARYRRDRPIWADPFVADLARTVRSGVVLAAVRSGTEGMPYGEGAAAPFRAGRYLFSHNGRIPGWPGAALDLARSVPADRLVDLDAPTDSALLWALVQQRLAAGSTLAEALGSVVAVAARTGARLNLLATDGACIVATAWGDTLWWREGDHGVVVASEPFDDDAGWQEAPDRTLLTVTAARVAISLLTADDGDVPERTDDT